jgi:hypothetical protein
MDEPGEEWIDITSTTSTHEIQLEINSNRYRHRPLNLNRYARSRHMDLDNTGIDDWVPGHPDEQARKDYNRSQLTKWDTKPERKAGSQIVGTRADLIIPDEWD